MSQLYDVTRGIVISQFVQFELDQDITQIITTSLDGTKYIQNIGRPNTTATGSVYVNRPGKILLSNAYTCGNQLRLDLKYGTYLGRIISCKFGKRMATDYFEATVKIGIEAAA